MADTKSFQWKTLLFRLTIIGVLVAVGIWYLSKSEPTQPKPQPVQAQKSPIETTPGSGQTVDKISVED